MTLGLIAGEVAFQRGMVKAPPILQSRAPVEITTVQALLCR